MSVEIAAGGARAEVLRKIRTAIGEPACDEGQVRTEWESLPRDYTRTSTLCPVEILALLEDRLRDYDASVARVDVADAPAEVARLLTERGVQRLVIPVQLTDILGFTLPEGFDFVPDSGLTAAELDTVEGVITGATVAIAETGTLVLQNVPGQGRRAPTLVPDYHLCILRAADVVQTVAEAMDRLQATSKLATTFISGPSATADIEMTRIKGVHGPRFLDVVVIP